MAILAMELGEHNAKKFFLLKKNSLCGSILQSLFQIFKNWLKRISALTAYVWGAAPCSSLPTADENAVTESAVTTVSSSLYQSAATVLTKNEFLYSSVLLSEIFKPQEFRISCLAMVFITAVLKGGWAYSSSTSVRGLNYESGLR